MHCLTHVRADFSEKLERMSSSIQPKLHDPAQDCEDAGFARSSEPAWRLATAS